VDAIPGLALLALVVLAFVAQIRGETRAREHIAAWAVSNRMTVRSVTRRWVVWSGPFLWRRSRAQRLYDVTVVDSHGNARRGRARVGGWVVGALDSRVDVEWR
jgi:hypothetical protein